MELKQQQKQQDVGRHDHGPESEAAANVDVAEQAVQDLQLSSSKADLNDTAPGSKPSGAPSTAKRIILPIDTTVAREDVEELSEAMAARLHQVRIAVQTFLNQRFSVYEYTVPRLFIALPDDHDDGGEGASVSSKNRFRVYFLCECSASFTVPLGSGLNHLHIAKHPGYEIDPGRKDEFFKRYGSMILVLLYFLKYGYDPAVDILSPTSPQAASHSSRQGLEQDLHQQQQHPQQQQQQQQSQYPQRQGLEAPHRKVEKVSKLRRSDLPESIAEDVTTKFDRMIQYLEDLQSKRAKSVSGTDSDNGHGQDEGIRPKREELPTREEGMSLNGLATLSDLHLLYSFLGIADIGKRLQSGQLGNLFRVSNGKGQVGWVCVYHYRWTFLERNIDEFERWIVTRRGLFDKQSGSLSITLVSRSQTRTFCNWIMGKVNQSLVEVHVKLGWHFGKKDLGRLAKALARTTVTILSLDGCSYAEDSTYNILHKKYDPILHLLTQGQLHSLGLSRFPSMFARLSSKTVKATTLKRLEFGPGMEVGSKDRGAFSHFIASCSSLEQLILPGFGVSELHMQSIMTGIRTKTTLVTLDLSNSQLNDGGAIILAQGLFSTNICHLDLSRNEKLSDTTSARVIRAIGPRLTSLKMAQTGFGDLAAAALAKAMDGISITNTLRDKLHLQHRLDVAAIVAGHRPGIRITVDNPVYSPAPEVRRVEAREKTHSRGHLVYLDIEDNHCTVQGFKSLAKVKSHLHFVYLNLSGSKGLQDKECAQILERVASSSMVTLRLAWTGFGDQSAKVLAKALMVHAARDDGPVTRMTGPCQLEELDLQACPIGPDGLRALCEAFAGTQAASCLRIVDLGHCGYLHDHVLQQLVATLVIKNGTLRNAAAQFKGKTLDVSSSTNEGEPNKGLPRSSSDPIPRSHSPEESEAAMANVEPHVPPRTTLPMPLGFFTNLQQLDLKSTQIGDDTAWLLSQALVQTWTMIHSLTILEPIAMSMQGVCWILEALRENTSVQEFGIGKSNITRPSDLDDFGSALAGLIETNKRIRSLTTLGAPLGSIAKGLLLNQTLHSLYLIRSKGQFEDLQLMGQALGFTRTLLVFWMGGSDDSLLGPLQSGVTEQQVQEAVTAAGGAGAGAGTITPVSPSDSSRQLQQRQESLEQQGQESKFRAFHLSHQQKDQPHHAGQQQRGGTHHSRFHTRSVSKYFESLLRSRSAFQSRPGGSSNGGGGSSVARKHRVSLEGDFKSSSNHNSLPLHPLSTPSPVVTHHVAEGKMAMGATTDATPSGMSGLWTRHPIIEGVRRNHSLIKVVLDTTTTTGATAATATTTTTPGFKTLTGGSQANMKAAGSGEERISRDHARSGIAATTQEFYYTQQELQQFQMQQQQVLHKKIHANRKLLRERARVGWEELKLVGVDDDIIREVCQEP